MRTVGLKSGDCATIVAKRFVGLLMFSSETAILFDGLHRVKLRLICGNQTVQLLSYYKWYRLIHYYELLYFWKAEAISITI